MVNCIRGKYIYVCTGTVLLFVLVYIPGTSIFFIWGHVHSCTVHCCCIICIYICVTTAVCVCRTVFVKVANPVRGQLAEQGKWILPCPRSRLRIWSRETGSTVPSRVGLLISILRLNLVLTYEIPPEFRGGVHSLSVHIVYYECSSTYMYILCTMISTASLSFSVNSTNECSRVK